jgi:hypothetical protein
MFLLLLGDGASRNMRTRHRAIGPGVATLLVAGTGAARAGVS